MDSEAETPALTRLERAIGTLEAAVAHRRQADDAARSTKSGHDTERDDLSRRHEALKTAVAACLDDIDKLLRSGDPTDA